MTDAGPSTAPKGPVEPAATPDPSPAHDVAGGELGSEGLARRLSHWQAGAFVVSSMVGAGVFTLPGVVRATTGSGFGALGAWIAGGLLALCGALCYAELGVRMPMAGGEYRYLERVYGPLWGFLSGWTSFVVGFSAAIAAASLGMVAYLDSALPAWQLTGATGWGVSRGAVLAAVVIMGISAVHLRGAGLWGRMQTLLAASVLVGIFGLVLVGLSTEQAVVERVAASTEATGSWWVALLQVSFAYAGWNAAAYLGGELEKPRLTLPKALVGGTALVILAYLALNVLFLAVIPPAEWTAEIAVGHTVARRMMGPEGARALSGLIALAILGSISAMAGAGPRVYFAMARDGLAPRSFAGVAEGSRVPVVAITAQAALASVLALTGSFEPLLVYIGAALLVFSGAAVLGVMVLRHREGEPESGFRVPLYPLPPVLFLALTAGATIFSLIDRPVPTLSALATLAAGTLVYRLLSRAGLSAGG